MNDPMTTTLGTFPFGAPVLPCGDQLPHAVDAVLVRAYPSALHVRWTPPPATGLPPIAALAVDNEPSVFWNGEDAQARVDAWKANHFNQSWGSVSPAHLNGPSGKWLEENVLAGLRASGIANWFITDCLTTYRLSDAAATRIQDTYERMVAQVDDLELAALLLHPSETRNRSRGTRAPRKQSHSPDRGRKAEGPAHAWERCVTGRDTPCRRLRRRNALRRGLRPAQDRHHWKGRRPDGSPWSTLQHLPYGSNDTVTGLPRADSGSNRSARQGVSGELQGASAGRGTPGEMS